MAQGLNNPTTSAIDNEVLQGFQRRSQEIGDQIAELRTTSTPVPTNIITADYVAKTTDQRISHVSNSPHSITEQSPKAVYNRRCLRENYGAGALTLIGMFIGAPSDKTGVWVNPVLEKGESLEFKSYFIPDPNGDENAPADLQINGVTSSQKGFYRYQIINHYLMKLPADYIEEKFEEIETNLQLPNLVLLFENKIEG